MGKTNRDPQGLAQDKATFSRRHGAELVTDESPVEARDRLIREKTELITEIKLLKGYTRRSETRAQRNKWEDKRQVLGAKLSEIDQRLFEMKSRTQGSLDTITAAYPRLFMEVARHMLSPDVFAQLKDATTEAIGKWDEQKADEFRKLDGVTESLAEIAKGAR